MEQVNLTTNKILITAKLIDGFWDRWIAHGIKQKDIIKTRLSIETPKQWVDSWCSIAERVSAEAKYLQQRDHFYNAEVMFRTAGLYFQLAQWLDVERTLEKKELLTKSYDAFYAADKLSKTQTFYETIIVNGYSCYGRTRIPPSPKGVIIIINPIDSTKEELFTYEMDFLDREYITVSFDGPGQGETYVFHGMKATTLLWEKFINNVISYTHEKFPQYKKFLFGTSSGAAWALYGSNSPMISKAVAVSPAFINNEIKLPDYFTNRMHALMEDGESILPELHNLNFNRPILIVHGKRDVMVSNQDIYNLYKRLPKGKKLIEFEEEGHCCNFKLPEIRWISSQWFREREGGTQ